MTGLGRAAQGGSAAVQGLGEAPVVPPRAADPQSVVHRPADVLPAVPADQPVVAALGLDALAGGRLGGCGGLRCGVFAAGFEPVDAGAVSGALRVLPPVPADGTVDIEEAVGAGVVEMAGAEAGTVALSDGPVAVLMSPLSLHAAIEKAASATLAPAVNKRVREVRTDMRSCPFLHVPRWCVDRTTEAC
ncbi:hypothetical protein ACIOJE_21595 [Kitasatospora sp. NPDC087861]|uniref:hypothetical protein n=1 Tax=Kitasatospora sp. NPDC087861 TaxID=3364070 RepID=UPI0037F6B7F4